MRSTITISEGAIFQLPQSEPVAPVEHDAKTR
jgi:hypothetical protein